MRTSRQLEKISELALMLQQERGDTEWYEADRDRINLAFTLLTEAAEHEPNRRYAP